MRHLVAILRTVLLGALLGKPCPYDAAHWFFNRFNCISGHFHGCPSSPPSYFPPSPLHILAASVEQSQFLLTSKSHVCGDLVRQERDQRGLVSWLGHTAGHPLQRKQRKNLIERGWTTDLLAWG